MRIAVLANLKVNAPTEIGHDSHIWDDLDGQETINALTGALNRNGHQAEFFEANLKPPFNLLEKLETFKPDLCFNIAEGHHGDSRESHIPALLEMLRIPYTASKVFTLALSLDKPMTKRILHYHELPTPEFQVFGSVDNEINEDLLEGDELKFPVFIKPSREGTGIGVTGKSVVETVAELKERVQMMQDVYRQPILCERFIKGRELTVGILGNMKPTAARRLNDRTAPHVFPTEMTFLPPMEIDTDKYDAEEGGIYTNKIKVDLVHDFHYTCPAKIDPKLEDELYRLAAATFRVTGCLDVARVDFRLDESDGNKPYILEINPLPGLNPEYSDLCIEAYASGMTYDELIDHIVTLAAERQGIMP
ncbi:MAG: hypothetical protein JW760_06280 [Spirochaetales bacterium]|nr:hypothetical protein [Spirochaetales bacterium]